MANFEQALIVWKTVLLEMLFEFGQHDIFQRLFLCEDVIVLKDLTCELVVNLSLIGQPIDKQSELSLHLFFRSRKVPLERIPLNKLGLI